MELGPALAAAARQQLRDLPNVAVVDGAFETWKPPPGEQFELVFAATAWHWLDPATRYRKAWSVLRPGGHLAFWSATHVFPDGGDPFREIQPVYEAIGEGLPEGAEWFRPGEVPDQRREIESSGCFDHVCGPDGTVRRHWGAALHVARRRENPTGDPAPNLRSRDG